MQLYTESAACASVTAAIAIGMEYGVLGLFERPGRFVSSRHEPLKLLYSGSLALFEQHKSGRAISSPRSHFYLGARTAR